MKTTIFTEVRIYIHDGKYYCDSSFNNIICRYCSKFGDITLVTRILNTDSIPKGFVEMVYDNLSFYNIGSLRKMMFSVRDKFINSLIKKSDLIILRLHSIISIKVYKYIKKYNKKYLCEVMGCAFDAYWNHGFVGKVIAVPMDMMIKKIIKESNYCIYVTEYFLQKRYPCSGIETFASNVLIEPHDKIKKYKSYPQEIRLFTAAAINVKYKGQQYVIQAMKKLKQSGISVKYYLAGKGDNRYLRRQAKKYGLDNDVIFMGMLTKEEVMNQMRQCDFYIQPSLQEGLPRSIIEAMSLGVVCLGSNTAGIPELLEEQCIFKRRSSKSIIKCIMNLKNYNLENISKRNFKYAKKYYNDVLCKKRDNFYDLIIKDVHK